MTPEEKVHTAAIQSAYNRATILNRAYVIKLTTKYLGTCGAEFNLVIRQTSHGEWRFSLTMQFSLIRSRAAAARRRTNIKLIMNKPPPRTGIAGELH